MGLDKFVNIIFPSHHNLHNKVILKNYIKEEFTYYPDSQTLCILCPPWHLSGFATTIVRQTLKRYKYSYLTYDIDPDVLSPDLVSTKKYFKGIITKMLLDIDRLDKKYKFIDIHIVGFSLGALYAINIANRNKKTSKVILVTMGNSLAECLYDGVSTVDLKDKLLENGITIKKFNNYMKEFNPEENISGLKNKEIRILMSRSDQVIKYKYGLKQIQKMRKLGINPEVLVNQNQGHYGTNLKFLLHPKNYL